jgi:hypothetical protein
MNKGDVVKLKEEIEIEIDNGILFISEGALGVNLDDTYGDEEYVFVKFSINKTMWIGTDVYRKNLIIMNGYTLIHR